MLYESILQNLNKIDPRSPNILWDCAFFFIVSQHKIILVENYGMKGEKYEFLHTCYNQVMICR